MSLATVKFLLAAGLCSFALVSQAAPNKKYPAMLVEANVVAAQYSEQAIAFEVVVEVASDGEHKTLQLSGQAGMQVGLWPGEYYRVTEFGFDGARLEWLTPQEKMDLFLKRPKKKSTRQSR